MELAQIEIRVHLPSYFLQLAQMKKQRVPFKGLMHNYFNGKLSNTISLWSSEVGQL